MKIFDEVVYTSIVCNLLIRNDVAARAIPSAYELVADCVELSVSRVSEFTGCRNPVHIAPSPRVETWRGGIPWVRR